MGCDIHTYCEVKRKDLDYWLCAARIFKNTYDNSQTQFVSMDDDGDAFGEPYSINPYDGRSYNLFGILAGVRNGTWGDAVKPISEPRGLPGNVSAFVKKQSEEWGNDGHSHSYLTLEELENFDWHQKVKMDCYVSKKDAEEYKKNGTLPNMRAAWSSVGVKLQFEEEIYPKYFMEKVMPQLRALKKFGDVRIVFWFDN